MTALDDANNVLKYWFSEQPIRLTPLNGRSPNEGWLVETIKNRFVLKNVRETMMQSGFNI